VVERSDTTGYEMGVKAAGTPVGVQDLMPRCCPVVSSLTLLNHRLLAAMPPASSRSKSVINGQEEYTCALIEMAKTRPVRGPGLQKYTYERDRGLISKITGFHRFNHQAKITSGFKSSTPPPILLLKLSLGIHALYLLYFATIN
jgi:hypothetical protein